MPTTAQLIQLAYKNARVGDDREQISGERMNDGLMRVNEILENWSANGILIPYNSTIDIPLVANQADYVVEPRIVEFLEGQIQSSDNTLNRLKLADLYNFNSFNFDNTKGRPKWVYIAEDKNLLPLSGAETSTVSFYPVPDASYTARLQVKQPIGELTLEEEILNVPKWFLKGLRYQLAVDISGEYGTVLNETFLAEHARLMTQLEASVPHDYHVNTDNPFRDTRRYKPWGFWYVG